MKQRNFALAATIAFSAIATFPTISQAADASTHRANQCRIGNDIRTQLGLPTVDCAALEKSAGGVMGPVRSMDTQSGDRLTMSGQTPTPGSAGNLTQY
jgi:hypothetical protein